MQVGSNAESQRSWWKDLRRDLARYKVYRPKDSIPALFATEQGLWALLQYRIASHIYRSRSAGGPIKAALLVLCVLWQKGIEITTGISLPYAAKIGPGLYIGHFGGIIVNHQAVLGESCNLSQGVTIGVSGFGKNRGTPVIGDRVYICANAVVAGKLTVGNDVVIGGNSLVTDDVPDHVTVVGVPAVISSQYGSEPYIQGLADGA